MMSMKNCLGLVAIALLMSVLSFPANADCKSDAEAIEKRLIDSPPKKTEKRRKVNRMMKEAKQALSEGKEIKCRNKLNAIVRIYGSGL